MIEEYYLFSMVVRSPELVRNAVSDLDAWHKAESPEFRSP